MRRYGPVGVIVDPGRYGFWYNMQPMSKIAVIFCALVFAGGVQASWYWPFGSDEGPEESPRRISELMEPATKLIDEASDFAADGKVDESVESYRKALMELDRIERENPERAKGSEFATLRNKRAYVNAAIDSMLLGQVKKNAKAVAVSDTTELERKLAEERGEDRPSTARPSGLDEDLKPRKPRATPETSAEVPKPSKLSKPAEPPKPLTKREQAMEAISSGDYATAEGLIKEMLAAKPNGAMALNLRAAMEMKQGRIDVAEATLDQAIMSNPRSYFAYYNLARLLLQKDAGNKAVAKRYYETGRAMGGPEDAVLEALIK